MTEHYQQPSIALDESLGDSPIITAESGASTTDVLQQRHGDKPHVRVIGALLDEGYKAGDLMLTKRGREDIEQLTILYPGIDVVRGKDARRVYLRVSEEARLAIRMHAKESLLPELAIVEDVVIPADIITYIEGSNEFPNLTSNSLAELFAIEARLRKIVEEREEGPSIARVRQIGGVILDILRFWDVDNRRRERTATLTRPPKIGILFRPDGAACKSVGHEEFFTLDPKRQEVAKEVCRICPVRVSCHNFAEQNNERYGMWGGIVRDKRSRKKNT